MLMIDINILYILNRYKYNHWNCDCHINIYLGINNNLQLFRIYCTHFVQEKFFLQIWK